MVFLILKNTSYTKSSVIFNNCRDNTAHAENSFFNETLVLDSIDFIVKQVNIVFHRIVLFYCI